MSPITPTELRAFHKIDREGYARLVFELGLDCNTSKNIVALWYWLETVGHKNFVLNSLRLAPTWLLDGLAYETLVCLNCLDKATFSHAPHGDHLQLMSEIGGKPLSLELLYARKESAKIGITNFLRDVCDIAFTDIVATNNLYNQVQLLATAVQPQVNNIHRQEDNGNRSQIMANPQAHHEANQESQANRTLFVTFSRGHPVTREQLREFFIRKFGEDCIENILMDDVQKSLYARVIVKSLSYVTKIVRRNEIKQFNIHGKNIRVRRFIPRGAPVASSAPAN